MMGFMMPPQDLELEGILTAMGGEKIKVGDLEYVDPVAYATAQGMPLNNVLRAVEYGTVGRAIVRHLAPDEIDNLVSSGVPEEVARRAVTYQIVRRVKRDTSGSPLLIELEESVGD